MRIGRVRRIVVTGVLVAVAAGCGGGDDGGASEDEPAEEGVSLEDWAEEADEICEDARDEADDLGLESLEDVAERGEESVEIAQQAVEDIEDLEAPEGDDAAVAAELVDALDEFVALQEEILDEVGDDGRDEMALVEIALDNAEVVEDGVDAANEAQAVGCRETFDRRQEALDQYESVLEGSEDFVDIRVGDCLAGVEDDPQPVDCDDGAEAEITATSLTGGDCRDEEESVGVGAGITYCLELLSDPGDADGLLQIGSCIFLEDAANETVNVTELPCGDLTVTHVVVESVRRRQPCEPGDRRFDKSEAEIADSGPLQWCAEPIT